MCPVAMAEALAVVNVGNSEWLFRKLTPSRANAAIAGAVASSTMRERRPSATNSTTLWGRGEGDCAEAAQAPTIAIAAKIGAPLINDENRYMRILRGTFPSDRGPPRRPRLCLAAVTPM